MQNSAPGLFIFTFLVCLFLSVIPSHAAGGVTIDGGAAYTNSTSVTLSITYPSTATRLDISEPGGKSITVTPSNTVSFSVSSGVGAKTIQVTAYYTYLSTYCCGGTDLWGNCKNFCTQEENAEETYSGSIILDTTKPVLNSLWINGGAQYTNSTTVTLNLSGSDNKPIMGMRFSNYSGAWSPTEKYVTVKKWDIPSGDGYKLVSSQLLDAAGNWSDIASSGIFLDTTPPGSSINAPATDSSFSGSNVQISGTAVDGAGSGIQKIEVSTDGGKTWIGPQDVIKTGGSATWFLEFYPPAEGTYPVLSRATDNANNVESPGPGIRFTVDDTKPSSSIYAFSWKKVSPVAAASIAVSPGYSDDRTVFTGTSGGGVFKSGDGGESWTAIPDLAGLKCLKAALSPAYASDQSVLIGTENGLFKSEDGGATWSSSDVGLPSDSIRDIAFSPDYTDSGTVFAITGSGDIYKTDDGGASWYPAGATLSQRALTVALSPDFVTDNTIFAGTAGAGLFKSTDGGASWNQVGPGMANGYAPLICISPEYASDKTVFAYGTAVDGSGPSLYKSTDGGASWICINTGISGLYITSLGISPAFASDNTIYIGTSGGVFKSTDGGSAWISCNSGLTGFGVETLAISPGYDKDNTLFTGVQEGIFKSSAGTLLVSGASFAITGSASDDGSGVRKVEISTDGGRTWTGPQGGVTDAGDGSWKKWSYSWAVPADGTYSIESRATDNAGNVEGSGAGITAIVDNTASVSGISSPAPGASLTGALLTISGSAKDAGFGVKKVQVLLPVSGSYQWVDASDTSGDGSWSTWSCSITIPANGGYALQSRAIDYSNIVEVPLSSVNITVANVYPSSSISSPKNGALIRGDELGVTGTAIDNSGLGISHVQFMSPAAGDWVDAVDISGNGSWSAWSCSISMPADGKYALKSRAIDNLGNIETPGAGNIITVDNTKPVGKITINNEAPATNKTPVTLTLSATDSSGVTGMRVCGDGDFGAVPWESLAASMGWSLPAGDGVKTIYAQFMDAAGNESDVCSANIILDTAGPLVNITYPQPSSILYGSGVDITGTASDTGSGVDKVEISFGDGRWTEASGGAAWNFSWALPNSGNFIISARATDKAGNISEISSVPISIDDISPVAIEPADNSVRPAAYTMPPDYPDPPVFKWAQNTCGNFKIYLSQTPDFKMGIQFTSDNHGISSSFHPTAESWNKVTKLGREIFWRVAGQGAGKHTLYSVSRTLFLDGGFTDIADNPSTDFLNIPSMSCDPGANSSLSMQFSSEPYFIAPVNSPKLKYSSTVSFTPGKGTWSNITRLGTAFYWRFSGKLSTGETTFSEPHMTSVTGGPEISAPSADSTLDFPPVITWDAARFASCTVQASASEDFESKPLKLGVSKTGGLTVGKAAWKKITALGSPVYIRALGTTADKYTAYGPPLRLFIAK